MNKGSIIKLFVFFLLFVLSVESVYAWSWSGLLDSDDGNISEKLKEIDLKVQSFTENKRVMKFINSNMFDEGVDTVEISIKNKGQIIKTYYIVRAEKRTEAPSIVENIPDQSGVMWKFRPTIDQALDGLDLASDSLLILEQKEKSKLEVVGVALDALYMYYTVESENLPPLNEIIQKSSCRKCKKALSWIGL